MSSPFGLFLSSSSSDSPPPSYLITRPPSQPPSPMMPPSLMGPYNNGVLGSSGGTEAAGRQGRHQQHPPLPRPPARHCPRCGSANTKFCYYNNYSRTQPRYLCKACRRHWTEGGTLRAVPIGGGRKNKRSGKSSTTATTTAAAKASGATATTAAPAAASSEGFPEILRQFLLRSSSAVSGGYNVDMMSAWQQAAAGAEPVVPQSGECDVGVAAAATAAMEVNCGGAEYWSGWEDEISGLDGTC